ncbi:MAG: c-type cytochrome domain-containing protein [Verrucomicrobiia bacterium]
MKRTTAVRNGLAALLLSAAISAGAAEKKHTFEDDVMPILRNRCLKCHNANDVKGGLDLSSFSAALRGGAGGEILNGGDPEGSKLFNVVTQAEEPTMPPNSGPIAAGEIDILRKWIAGGLLETSGSKAIKSNKPKMDLAVGAGDIGKPKGPPAMPKDWLLEPFVRTERNNAILTMAHSPWAPLVALGDEKQVLLYNTDSLELAGVIPFAEGFPTDIKFSRNGKLLLVGGGYGAQVGLVAVYDVASGERVIQVGDEFDSVLAADISADQKFIALGGPSKLVKVYSTVSGEQIHSMKKHTDWITAAEFSPDGKLLATGDRGGGVLVWDSASGENLYVLRGHRGPIRSVSWRADSDVLISASEDASVKMWKVEDEALVKTWNAHGGGTLFARYALNGNIVTAGRDSNFATWTGAGATQKKIKAIADLPVSVTFNHDAKRIIGGDWAGNVGVWNSADGKLIGKLDSNPPSIAMRLDTATKTLAAKETVAKAASDAHVKAAAASATTKVAADKNWAASQVGKISSLTKQADSLNKQIAAAGAQELARLQAGADKAAAVQTAAEKQVADLKARLAKTDPVSPTYKNISTKLEIAKKQTAAAAKGVDDALKALADLSVKSLAAAEAEAKKFKDALVKTDKTSTKFQELMKQAIAANQKNAEAAKAEAAKLQGLTNKTIKELAAAETNVAQLAEQLKKTEKTNKTYSDLQKAIATASKKAADSKAPAAAAKKLVADLKASHGKANSSLAAGQAETAKIIEALKKTDPSYLAYAAETKKLEAANKAVVVAKAALDKANGEVPPVRTNLARWKTAAFNVTLYAARAELEKRQNEAATKVAEARDVEGEIAKIKQEIKKTDYQLASVPDKLVGLKNIVKYDAQWVNDAKAGLKQATDNQAKANAALKQAVVAADKAKSNATVAENNLTKVEELTKKIAGAKKGAAEKSAAAKKVAGELAAARKTVAKAESEANAASAATAKVTEARKTAEAAAAKAKAELKLAQAAAAKAKDDAKLSEAAKAKADEVKKLELAAAAKAKNVETLTAAATAKKGVVAPLKSKAATVGKTATAAQAAATTAATALTSLQSEYAANKGDKAAMIAKAAVGLAGKLAKVVEPAKMALETAKKAVAAKQGEVTAESKNLDATNKALAELDAAAKKLPEQAKTLAANLKKSEAALAVAQVAAAESGKTALAQEAKVKQMAGEYAKMKGESPALQAKL